MGDSFVGNDNCVITGFGGINSWTGDKILVQNVQLPDTLQSAKIPVLGDQDCDEYYGIRETDNYICAGSLKGGADACKG